MLAGLTEAWNAGDLDCFMSGYAVGSSTLLLVSGKEIRGYTAIHNYYKALFDSFPQMPYLKIEELSIQSSCDTAKFELRFTLGNGDNRVNGISILTLIKSENRWRIVEDYSPGSSS